MSLALAPRLSAHDIPNDLTIQAWLKPENDRLRVLVRVPLKAMRDIAYPRRGTEFVDLGRAEPALHEAAVTWLIRDFDVYEGFLRLEDPQVIEVRAALPADESFRSYEAAIAHLTGPHLS